MIDGESYRDDLPCMWLSVAGAVDPLVLRGAAREEWRRRGQSSGYKQVLKQLMKALAYLMGQRRVHVPKALTREIVEAVCRTVNVASTDENLGRGQLGIHVIYVRLITEYYYPTEMLRGRRAAALNLLVNHTALPHGEHESRQRGFAHALRSFAICVANAQR